MLPIGIAKLLVSGWNDLAQPCLGDGVGPCGSIRSRATGARVAGHSGRG